MFKRILSAFDGSPQAIRGLTNAAEYAKKMGSKLSVVYVLENMPVPTRAGGMFVIDEELEAVAELELKKAAFILKKARVKAEIVVKRGNPAQEILRVADKGKFDLVVVGVRKLGGVSRLVRGSVSGTLMHHAHCTVLVVK